MSRNTPRASGYFRTSYAQDFALIQTRFERTALAVFVIALAVFPFLATVFYLDLACQVFLAAVGALSLMLLTGYAGQTAGRRPASIAVHDDRGMQLVALLKNTLSHKVTVQQGLSVPASPQLTPPCG